MHVNDLVSSVDEDEVEGDVGVLHPEVLHIVTVVEEKHARTPQQGRPEHEPLRLLPGRHRRFRLETAELTVFRVKEGDADAGKIRREGGKMNGQEDQGHREKQGMKETA